MLVGLGLWVRYRIRETPAFTEALERQHLHSLPFGRLLRGITGPRSLRGSAAVVACFAIFYLSTAFALGHMTTARGGAQETVLGIQLAANLFLGLGIVLAAIWSDQATRNVLITGSIGTFLLGAMFGPMLAFGSLTAVLVMLSFALLVMGFTYGPLGAWLPTLFPCRCATPGCRSPSMAAALSAAGWCRSPRNG